jgi:hypothetical protein
MPEMAAMLGWLVAPLPFRLALDSINRSNIYRALIANPGSAISLDEQCMYARNLEVRDRVPVPSDKMAISIAHRQSGLR